MNAPLRRSDAFWLKARGPLRTDQARTTFLNWGPLLRISKGGSADGDRAPHVSVWITAEQVGFATIEDKVVGCPRPKRTAPLMHDMHNAVRSLDLFARDIKSSQINQRLLAISTVSAKRSGKDDGSCTGFNTRRVPHIFHRSDRIGYRCICRFGYPSSCGQSFRENRPSEWMMMILVR